eukprot:g5443.t1
MYPGGSKDAAWGNHPPTTGSGAGPESRETALSNVVGDIVAMQRPFVGHPGAAAPSVPTWLGDLLANSLSHTRDSMWWEQCPGCHESKDKRVAASSFGVWRQWEAYDCPDIDSIHNDGERHIPYIMMLTDGTRSKLAAWAGNQQKDGMLAEQILNKAPDSPQGRVMSDSTSMFIVYVLELLRWDGDEATARLYWPTIKRAAAWINGTAAQFGVPLKLQTTYDILAFPEQYELNAYASMFHILAMKATAALAAFMDEPDYAAACKAAVRRAQVAMDLLQWNATNGFYNAGSNGCVAGKGCTEGVGIFADTMYAQVLAYAVGLGDLLATPARLDSHLAYVENANCVHNNISAAGQPVVPGCPNGLVIMTARPVGVTDLQVWEMATYDHVALRIRRAPTGAEAQEALLFARGTATSYSERMNDQWAIAGVKFNDGSPSRR